MMRLSRMNSRGQVLLLLALMLAGLLGIAALALDVGLAYGVKAKLNAAVDAAAIAALKERSSPTGSEDSAKAAAASFFHANFPAETMGISAPACTVNVATSSGSYIASVEANAVLPTFFAKILGLHGLTVSAKSEATRSNLDLALVLDTSGTLSTKWSTVRDRAVDFVGMFSEENDRVALVPFANGVGLKDVGGDLQLTDGVEIRKTSSGFSKAAVGAAIKSLTPTGETATELGIRIGAYELNKVSNPAAHRAIVLFSDGAPNIFTGNFVDTSGKTWPGNLYSETTDPGPPSKVYHADMTRDSKKDTIMLSKVPAKGGGNKIGTVIIKPELDVTNSQRQIQFVTSKDDKDSMKCDANKAARNMLENVANHYRSQGIIVHTIGFGTMLDVPEIKNCSTSTEPGSLIMRRVANTRDSDTYNSAQPSGIFCRAVTTDDLGPCFNYIADAMLRLTK